MPLHKDYGALDSPRLGCVLEHGNERDTPGCHRNDDKMPRLGVLRLVTVLITLPRQSVCHRSCLTGTALYSTNTNKEFSKMKSGL